MTVASRSVSRTNVGHRRKNNEDSHLCDEGHGLFVVADGMGGQAAGEVASETAIDQIGGMVHNQFELVRAYVDDPSPENAATVRRLMESAVQAATYMVFGMAEHTPEQRGMGTTISAVLLTPHGTFVAQVGDSRVYQLRGKKLVQITEDHTLVNQEVRAGRMTPDEARESRQGHLITRAVGTKEFVEVDTFLSKTLPRDRFLLSSDGLHDYVKDPGEIAGMVAFPDMGIAADSLIEFALGCGGKDNVTVVLVEVVE